MSNPPSPEEISRAAGAYDVALVAVTLIWVYLARRERATTYKRCEPSIPRDTVRLSSSHFRVVAASSIAIGLVGLWYLRFAGAAAVAEHIADLGEWSSSSWVTMTATWALQGFVMLHYIRGFPPTLTSLTAVVFLLTALGNAARYPLVVWFLFCCFIYLSRRGRRWPRLRVTALMALVALLWFPLKTAVASYWTGDDFMTILVKSKTYTEVALGPRGNGGDTTFLDQSAIYMALTDQHGSYFYGRTLVPLLTMPIPRQLWPNKPSLAEFENTISTPDRPVGQFGMVPGIVGEGYANFGYFGIVLFPMIAAYLYAAGYFRAMRHPHQSIQRFAYMICACILILVFRDGLVSMVVFTLVNSMPMTFILYLHLFFPRQIEAPPIWSGAASMECCVTRFVFWQNMPTHLQSDWIRRLAEQQGVSVQVILEGAIPGWRTQTGWEPPDYGLASVRVGVNPELMDTVIREAGSDAVHIFSGVGAYPRIHRAFIACIEAGRRVGVMAEMPGDYGPRLRKDSNRARGVQEFARVVSWRIKYLRFGRRIQFLLGVGEGAPVWFRKIGFASERVFEFAYFPPGPLSGRLRMRRCGLRQEHGCCALDAWSR